MMEWQTLKSRWQSEWQNNQRLRWYVSLAALLLVIWLHLLIDDGRQTMEKSVTALVEQRNDLHRVSREIAWPARAQAAEKERSKFRQMIWTASSDGEAQAKVRDVLSRLASTHGMSSQKIAVEVGAPVPGHPFRAVRADIQGTYQAGTFQRFVQAIETSQPKLLIEMEQIFLANKSNPRFRLVVVGWVELESAP